MINHDKLKVPLKKLCFEPKIPFMAGKTTNDIKPLAKPFFQERGFEAIDFGIAVKKKGFNIYVAGESGTGKTSNVRKYLQKIAATMPVPDDICYVYNFENEDEPFLVTLPAGKGSVFVKDMKELLEFLKEIIPKELESEQFDITKGELTKWYQDESDSSYQEMEEESAKLGFLVKSAQGGLVINPVVDGEPIDKAKFDSLPPKQQQVIKNNETLLQEKLITFFHRERQLEKKFKEKMTAIRQEMVRSLVSDPLKEIEKKYGDRESILNYFKDLKEHLLDNFDDFVLLRDIEEGKQEAQNYPIPSLIEYEVNLLINNTHLKGAPVIYETNPTFQNMHGYFEYEERHNFLFTDFTRMKPGSLHKANGGFLLIQANDILKNYYSWTALKRALRNSTLNLDDLDIDFRLRTNAMPKPQSLPLNIKVVLIGDEHLFHMLYSYDEDFRRIFRVKADFSSTVPVNSENSKKLINFISRVVTEDKLLPFDDSAISSVLYYSSRLADDQKKYMVMATDIVDIIVESNFWAAKDNKEMVTSESVRKALQKRDERHSRIRERYYESIEREHILLDVKSDVVGQINGLAVYSIGDFSFGIPSRITAKVFAGRRGIVNIDREVRLSGAIHDKGAMILAGFMGDKFAQDKLLSLSASITFEQSYGGVDGDSASSTELYVLLSAISGVPIKQSIAVTGSINQNGDIQPIGGVNEKIEGFFDICKIKGFTGKQGVIIPIQNVENLNLRPDVIDAVEKGQFSIYAINNVCEGIEILTGKKSGMKKKDGSFTKDSIFDLVNRRIKEFGKIER